MGLGAVADVSLADAREAAKTARAMIAKGLDPLGERKRVAEKVQAKTKSQIESIATPSTRKGKRSSKVPSFGDFADTYISTQEEGWKNAKHRQQWRNTINTHANAILDIPVNKVTTDDVVAVLAPIWKTVPETASRLRGRIENILDAAKAAKHISSPWENPARWKGNLVHLLSRRKKKSTVKHHPAMPHETLPDFYAKLRLRRALAARALELTILCATRTNETLQMKWSEVDLDSAIWVVPAERMKMGVEHRIPLSDRAVEILKCVSKGSNCHPDTYVFAGQKPGKALSNMSMTMVLRRMKLGHFTVHGMRSSFRDYMGDMTDHAETIVEHALAHQVGDETQRAYRRGNALPKPFTTGVWLD